MRVGLGADALRPDERVVIAVDSIVRRAHDKAMGDADRIDIQMTLSGEREAYGRIVQRHQRNITNRMWRFTRDRSDLEELVHEVFVEAYVSLDGFRGEAPFIHWLNRIATRVGYRFWKRRKRRTSHEVPLQDWDAFETDDTDHVSATEAAQMLHGMLEQLPPRDRLVLTLLYLEEMSVEQAAENCGWSKTMVKVQAYRARKKLRALLEKAEKPKR